MYKHSEITDKIIAAFYEVYNTLGYGFLERVYQGAMAIELGARGLSAIPQAPLKVLYKGNIVGDYFADFLVEGCVIVELKSIERLAPEHHVQLLNYLKATDHEIGLLLNFGPKPEIKRKVFEAARLQPNDSSCLSNNTFSDPISSASRSASSAGHSGAIE
jgi:GxxExxY protein